MIYWLAISVITEYNLSLWPSASYWSRQFRILGSCSNIRSLRIPLWSSSMSPSLFIFETIANSILDLGQTWVVRVDWAAPPRPSYAAAALRSELFLELLPNYKMLALPGRELFDGCLILLILMLPPGFPESGRLFLDARPAPIFSLVTSYCCCSGV